MKSIQNQIFQMTDTTVDYKLKVLTVSVGISAAPYAAKTAGELLANADMAVNHVKRSGKNGIEIFDTILRENLVQDDETDHRNIYRGYESTIYALTAAIQGHMVKRLGVIWRVAFAICAVFMFIQLKICDVIGLGMFVVLMVILWTGKKRGKLADQSAA